MSALSDACDEPAILREMARATWAKEHDDDECPPKEIPARGDLENTLLRAPESVHAELAACRPPPLRLTGTLVGGGLDGHLEGSPRIGPPSTETPPAPAPAAPAPEPEPQPQETVTARWIVDGGNLLAEYRLHYGDRLVSVWRATVEEVHAWWCAMPKGSRHPIALLVAWWQRWKAAVDPASGRFEVLEHRDKRYTRSTSLLDLATLAAVEVDGEPISTATPTTGLRQRRVVGDAPDELFPAPRRLAGEATGDMVFDALSTVALTGDERAFLRNDLRRLGRLVFALWRCTVSFTDGEGSHLLTGADTPNGRQRWRLAVRHARYLSYGDIDLFDAELGPDTALFGPARWWQRRQAGGPVHWVLTGGLFRRSFQHASRRRGNEQQLRGLIATLDGLEAAMVHGDYSIPIRPGGPGPEVFVSWRGVIGLSGEPINPDTAKQSTPGRRYDRRVDALIANHLVPEGGGAAPAGDTVEVVRVVSGNGRNQYRTRETGLMVRLSARYIEARLRVDKALAQRAGEKPEAAVWSRHQVSDLL